MCTQLGIRCTISRCMGCRTWRGNKHRGSRLIPPTTFLMVWAKTTCFSSWNPKIIQAREKEKWPRSGNQKSDWWFTLQEIDQLIWTEKCKGLFNCIPVTFTAKEKHPIKWGNKCFCGGVYFIRFWFQRNEAFHHFAESWCIVFSPEDMKSFTLCGLWNYSKGIDGRKMAFCATCVTQTHAQCLFRLFWHLVINTDVNRCFKHIKKTQPDQNKTTKHTRFVYGCALALNNATHQSLASVATVTSTWCGKSSQRSRYEAVSSFTTATQVIHQPSDVCVAPHSGWMWA